MMGWVGDGRGRRRSRERERERVPAAPRFSGFVSHCPKDPVHGGGLDCSLAACKRERERERGGLLPPQAPSKAKRERESPITNGGPMRLRGLTRLSSPAEEERIFIIMRRTMYIYIYVY